MSTATLFTFVTIITLLIITSSNGLDNIHERCTITEGAGVTVDSCDGSKFISCQNGRCTCFDASNQIYTSRIEKEKRQKRGLGKKVAIGAGSAFVGYEIAKATSGGGHSSKESSSKKKIFGCYGRIGAPCALDYNNVNIAVKLTNSTNEHSENETMHENNSSDITTVTFDLQKLPKCVDHGVCKPRNAADNSTDIKTNDPRIGVCTCDTGYVRTKADICESKAYAALPSSFVIIALLILSSKPMFS